MKKLISFLVAILLTSCGSCKNKLVVTKSVACESFPKIPVSENDQRIIMILDDVASGNSTVIYQTTYSSSILAGSDMRFSDDFLYSVAKHNAKHEAICSTE